MKVTCTTNLDLSYSESFPKELPCRPMKGDYIYSNIEHPQYEKDENGRCLGGKPTHFCRLRLEVCQVNFRPTRDGDYYCEVELTTPHIYGSMTEFYEYYARITNRSVSAFI